MRIGIDATAVSGSEGVGMQSYAANLTRSLLELDSRNEYVVYCRRALPEVFRPLAGRACFRIAPLGSRKACEQLWLAAAAPRDRLDLLHCMCSLPLGYRGASVLTVHGLSWRIFPEVFTTALRWYWILTAERTMKKATRLVSISGWTKGVVARRLGIPEERIDVVHHGVDVDQFAAPEVESRVEEVRKRYGLPQRFLVHVGSLIPVKNLPALVRAYGALIAARPDLAEVQLVLVGGAGWGAQEVREQIRASRLEDRVHLTGFVPEPDLPALYRAAELFVFPSLYEGFGIPALEAMASGTPLVCSRASCLPEVVGGAGLFFDPHDEGQMTEAMARALSDEALREALAERGRERAPRFSWKATAEGTLEAYERAFHAARRA